MPLRSLCTGVVLAWEFAAALVIVLGTFLAYGPYHDDRTWNLRRDSAKSIEVTVEQQDPTHFRLRQVVPTYLYDKWQSNPNAFLQAASPVLFVPGHMGKWTQVINIANYINRQRKVPVWSLDFHANPAGWHSSVLIQQAEFVVAAMERISELYRQAGLLDVPLTVIGHSMGGIVAMEAIQRLVLRRSNTQVRSLILLCTPILGHPLLVEPRSSIFLEDSRTGFWGASPPFTVVLAPGETDPMVPTEVVAIPEKSNGMTLVSGAVHGLHSSFSHVNILFSRPSLHIICKLVSAAVDGKLPQASKKLLSPLIALFQKQNHTDTRHGLSQITLQSLIDETGEDNWKVPKRVDANSAGFETLKTKSIVQSPLEIADIGTVSLSWDQFNEGKVHYVIGPRDAGAFDLVLFEEPRVIRREVEKGSRGEDFDEKDTVNCTALATMWVGPADDLEVASWNRIKPFSLQYPAKACIFRASTVDDTSLGRQMAVAIRRHRLDNVKSKRPRVSGFAQWHSDFSTQPAQGSAAVFPVFSHWFDWVKAIFETRRVTLPVGRAAVSYVAIPFEDRSPFYPVDIHASGGFSAPWGLFGLFLSSDLDGAGVHVSALRSDGPPSTWAAETNPRMFAPRYVPGISTFADGNLKHPLILVVSDPAVEITLHVTANIWSALRRFFRTYLGIVVASLAGSILILTYSRVARVGKLPCVSMWALASSLVTLYSAEAPRVTSSSGYSPGPPPFVFLLCLHFISLGFAMLCLRTLDYTSKKMAAACECCKCGVSIPIVLDISLWVIAIGVHPAISLLAMNTRGVLLLGSLHRVMAKNLAISPDGTTKSVEATHWLAGMVGLQFLYTLFYTPSIILTGWLLNGQHKEASTSQVQAALDEDLKVSRHWLSPLVDSYLLERRNELRTYIELPAYGLLLIATSLALYSSRLRYLRAGDCRLEDILQSKVAMLCHFVLLLFAIAVVPVVGHRPHRLWFACQPIYLLYTLMALSFYYRQSRAVTPMKLE